jgi:hypothetical protein
LTGIGKVRDVAFCPPPSVARSPPVENCEQ